MRRRGATLERAILDAAVAELAESGYAGLTMDRVAARAGTNKNAIYRRWPNRAALALAAYRELAEAELTPPETGDLRSDVLTLLRRVNASARFDLLRGLVAEVDPQLLRDLPAAPVWQRIAGDVHPRVATVAIDLLRSEYLTRGLAAVPDEVIVEIVDEVYLPLVRRSHAP
ncbi:helix-turn-helix domain-containing protein [Actinokineospora sp. NPDC004072]